MTDIVERLRERGEGQEMFGFDGMLDDGDPLLIEAADALEQRDKEIERLRAERDALKVDLDICRDAIENCYLAVEDCLPTDSDSDAAVHRCTRRRLNEAVGKATPRLMFERAEGQRFYGLHWKELMAERDALRADALRYRWLRDRPWHPELSRVVALHKNRRWDAAIDAAMAVQTKNEK